MRVPNFPGRVNEGVSNQQDGSDRYCDIGNVKNRPAQVTDTTIYEVDNLLFREPVDQVPYGAPRYQSKRVMLPSLRLGRPCVVDDDQEDGRNRDDQDEHFGIPSQGDPKGRPPISNQGESEVVTPYRRWFQRIEKDDCERFAELIEKGRQGGYQDEGTNAPDARVGLICLSEFTNCYLPPSPCNRDRDARAG